MSVTSYDIVWRLGEAWNLADECCCLNDVQGIFLFVSFNIGHCGGSGTHDAWMAD